jgi:hypothetical protein
LISQDARARANTGIYFGEEKRFETEVGEVYERSRKKETISISMSDPNAPGEG